MNKKYYGVKKGRKIGVFNSWDECKMSVEGYQNALYKSFYNYEDAYFFVWGKYVNETNNDNTESNEKFDIIAYIDGSYDNDLKRYSYAGIIFYNGKRYEFAKSEDDPNLIEFRNVAGELKAAMFVMNYAKMKGAKNILINYDYAGIEYWAKGAWKANNEYTKYYALYVNDLMKDININFNKIKSHTGNKYNDEADKLAKKVLLEYYSGVKKNNAILEENLILSDFELNVLKSSKKSLDIGYLINGKLIGSENIYNKFKEHWKLQKKSLKDISELKSFYDIENECFIILVYTEDERKIIKISKEEVSK